MRWKLAKKLLSRKSIRLDSHKRIKRFQAVKYAKLINATIQTVEDQCWKIWFPYINYFKWGADDRTYKPLPLKPILSDGFDGQPEIIVEYFRESI